MRYLVQSVNVALFAVILGQFVDCGSSLRTFCGREAGMPVTALLDRKGNIVLGVNRQCRIHEFHCIESLLHVPGCLSPWKRVSPIQRARPCYEKVEDILCPLFWHA